MSNCGECDGLHQWGGEWNVYTDRVGSVIPYIGVYTGRVGNVILYCQDKERDV